MHRHNLWTISVILSSISSAIALNEDRVSVYVHPPRQVDAFARAWQTTTEAVLGRPASFVGEGDEGLVVVVEGDSGDFVPPSMARVDPIREHYSSLSSWVNELSKYAYPVSARPALDMFTAKFLDPVFGSGPEAARPFLTDVATLAAFVEGEDDSGVFHVTGLSDIVQQWGPRSEQYTMAVRTLEATLQSAIARSVPLTVLISPSFYPAHSNRQVTQPPSQSPFPQVPPSTAPIHSTSTCFSSESVCGNATNGCSSRGTCIPATRAGRTCFVCQCTKAPLFEGGRNISWAGDMCQKKDISTEFSLIVGTVLFLIVTAFGSISLLSSVGAESLPGVLTTAASSGNPRNRD